MEQFLPYIGYTASGLILLSFIMKDMFKLRVINSIGCAIFVLYGLMIPSNGMPIVITNAAILCVNIYYLTIKKK